MIDPRTDPRMPTDPVEAPCAASGLFARLVAEARDHVWPWSRHGFARARTLQAAGLAAAAGATLMWLLAAAGRLEAGAVVGGWLAWSVFEVVVRLTSKPYVKEGPWWGRQYRRATPMDMLCYVGFKNLLIGAALFLVLKAVGALTV